MIEMKKGVGHITHRGVISWLKSIHNDTIKHGSEDQQFVLEQMLHYVKTEYKDKNGLENKNLMGY